MRLLGPLALFTFGLVLRLLFQAATPDGGVGWHVGFQGDAPAWQDLAARLAQGVPDVELTLPLRPPGMIQGLAWLWNGEGATVGPVRLLFVVLGAYFVWFWSDGRRTLPMRTIGVRLVDDAGRPLGRGRAVRRYLWAWLLIAIPIAGAGWLHPACLLLLPLPYFSALLDPQRRTLYDRLAGTRLIVDTRPVA